MSYDLRFSKYCWFRNIITTSSVATQYSKKVFLDIYTEDIVIWYTLNWKLYETNMTLNSQYHCNSFTQNVRCFLIYIML